MESPDPGPLDLDTLHAVMAPVLRDLLADVEEDVELMRQHGHTRAADRAKRKVEKLPHC